MSTQFRSEMRARADAERAGFIIDNQGWINPNKRSFSATRPEPFKYDGWSSDFQRRWRDEDMECALLDQAMEEAEERDEYMVEVERELCRLRGFAPSGKTWAGLAGWKAPDSPSDFRHYVTVARELDELLGGHA